MVDSFDNNLKALLEGLFHNHLWFFFTSFKVWACSYCNCANEASSITISWCEKNFEFTVVPAWPNRLRMVYMKTAGIFKSDWLLLIFVNVMRILKDTLVQVKEYFWLQLSSLIMNHWYVHFLPINKVFIAPSQSFWFYSNGGSFRDPKIFYFGF